MARQAVAVEVVVARRLDKLISHREVVQADHALTTGQVLVGQILANQLETNTQSIYYISKDKIESDFSTISEFTDTI